MRKLATTVVGMAVLCGMTAFAQPATTGTPSTTPGENPPPHAWQPRPGGEPEMDLIHNAIREVEENPALAPLVSQALTDRAALLQSELARITQLQALLTAIQGGDKAAIQAAHEALKTSSETVEANRKTFREACRAIREAMPRREHHERHTAPASGTTGNS